MRNSWGLKLADGSQTGSYLPATTELVLNAPAAEHARFAALLAEADASNALITISAKLISLPSELAGSTDRIVNAEEWEQIIRDWSQKPEIDVIVCTWLYGSIGNEVSSRIDDDALVEVNQEAGANFGEITVDRRTGLRLLFTTQRVGGADHNPRQDRAVHDLKMHF